MSNFYPVESLAKGKVSVENLPFAVVKNPSVVSVQLTGQNLESHGIFDGDFLVFDFNAEIKAKCFAMIWRNDDYECYMVESITAKRVCLKNDIRRVSVKPSEILGRVIRLERGL